jgi:hypothetical protein
MPRSGKAGIQCRDPGAREPLRNQTGLMTAASFLWHAPISSATSHRSVTDATRPVASVTRGAPCFAKASSLPGATLRGQAVDSSPQTEGLEALSI